jgi:hypothetical protein
VADADALAPCVIVAREYEPGAVILEGALEGVRHKADVLEIEPVPGAAEV